MEAMKISVVRKSQPVELEMDAEGNVVKVFVKEMTGAQRDEYFNKTSQRSRVDQNTGEVVGIKDYKGLYSTLLAFCVYDAEGKPLPESKIQEWPDGAQRAMFEIARKLNKLGNDEGDEKN